MAEPVATDHADGRLRQRAQSGGAQFDVRLMIRRCSVCGKPAVLIGGICVPDRIAAGLPVPVFTRRSPT